MADTNVSLTMQILEAVARHAQTNPLDLPRLYNSIDTDAMEALMQDSEDSGEMAEISVTFNYAGYDVTVTNDGTIAVENAAVAVHGNRPVGDD